MHPRDVVARAEESAVAARHAASVVMTRQAGSDLEVYVQHRATTMDFAAGAVVFPGGRTEAVDAAYDFGPTHQPLMNRHATGWQRTSLADPDQITARGNASMMLRTGLREVEEETGAVLPPSVMYPWANLITPEGYPKRFDTFFYVATPGDDILPENITTEATAAEWLTITAILQAADEQRIALMLPTRMILLQLAKLGTVEALVARDEIIEPIRNL